LRRHPLAANPFLGILDQGGVLGDLRRGLQDLSCSSLGLLAAGAEPFGHGRGGIDDRLGGLVLGKGGAAARRLTGRRGHPHRGSGRRTGAYPRSTDDRDLVTVCHGVLHWEMSHTLIVARW